MAKVTSKYQVTVPKAIAELYRIRPGDEIDWQPGGDVIRVIPGGTRVESQSRESQLRLFEQATQRLRQRPARHKTKRPDGRGWNREDLYGRGRSH
jgi:AbrB family looped-hinge helix DNA binding protein